MRQRHSYTLVLILIVAIEVPCFSADTPKSAAKIVDLDAKVQSDAPQVERRRGESEESYQARLRAAIRAAKAEKTVTFKIAPPAPTVERRRGESEASYQARLRAAERARQGSSNSNTITGYGKVPYTADECILTLSVTTPVENRQSSSMSRSTIKPEQLAQVYKQHRSNIENIQAYIQETGGPKASCKQMPTFLDTENEDYNYHTNFTVRIPREAEMAVLQQELMKRGVTQFHSMTLQASNYEDLINQAKQQAQQQIKVQIDNIAKSINRKVVKLQDITYHIPRIIAWQAGQPNQITENNQAYKMIWVNPKDCFETFVDITIKAKFEISN